MEASPAKFSKVPTGCGRWIISSAKNVIVAIDGPSGAGKSTIAKRVAVRLGYVHINSGSLYRAVALWALRLQVPTSDITRVAQLAREALLELTPDGRTFLNGEDVTKEIRDEQVSHAASTVAAYSEVRRALLPAQRKVTETSSVVMEGRDIGTVVFPHAQVKIFLDAEPAERSRRRIQQLGPDASEETAAGMSERDRRDRTRAEAPLVQAGDAQLLDTTGLTIEEVEEAVLRLVRARISNGEAR